MNRSIYIFILLLVTACSNHTYDTTQDSISENNSPTVNKLLDHYNEWRGVKYREGGMSKNGVDCSGFVHLAYKQQLNKSIPRSTALLSENGREVSKDKLRPGDVMFFKTGFKVRHVGIYVGSGEFIHASTSYGVTKSSVSNPYWLDAYWMSRRY